MRTKTKIMAFAISIAVALTGNCPAVSGAKAPDKRASMSPASEASVLPWSRPDQQRLIELDLPLRTGFLSSETTLHVRPGKEQPFHKLQRDLPVSFVIDRQHQDDNDWCHISDGEKALGWMPCQSQHLPNPLPHFRIRRFADYAELLIGNDPQRLPVQLKMTKTPLTTRWEAGDLQIEDIVHECDDLRLVFYKTYSLAFDPLTDLPPPVPLQSLPRLRILEYSRPGFGIAGLLIDDDSCNKDYVRNIMGTPNNVSDYVNMEKFHNGFEKWTYGNLNTPEVLHLTFDARGRLLRVLFIRYIH